MKKLSRFTISRSGFALDSGKNLNQLKSSGSNINPLPEETHRLSVSRVRAKQNNNNTQSTSAPLSSSAKEIQQVEENIDDDDDDIESESLGSSKGAKLGPDGRISQKIEQLLDSIPEEIIEKEVPVNTKEMQSEENARLMKLQTKYLSQRDPFKIYSLKETLGTGSVGEVVFGITSEGQKVAIKKLKIIKKGKNRLPFILREIEIIATSQHENIVKYIESFQMASEELWVVMEYMSGGSLYDMLKLYPTGFRFVEADVAYIIRETLAAVAYLHSMNRLHRDIKVDNVLFSRDGYIKLADFGTAIQLQRNIKRTTLVGTPYYMAPELIKRQPYDGSVDIWSIGITVVELIEGEPPYYELDPQEALSAIVESQGQPEKVGLTGSKYSNLMKDFVNSNCLQFEPAKRSTAVNLLKHPFITKACTRQEFAKKVSHELKESHPNECVLF